MRLYHGTKEENFISIMTNGILPSRIGIVYLSPDIKVAKSFSNNEIVLEVETGNLKLTAFEDCKDWEVLCWGKIPPENIIKQHS